jgi:hypothetical protein
MHVFGCLSVALFCYRFVTFVYHGIFLDIHHDGDINFLFRAEETLFRLPVAFLWLLCLQA